MLLAGKSSAISVKDKTSSVKLWCRQWFFWKSAAIIQLFYALLYSSFFTSIGNKSRISVSNLFHQRRMFRDGRFIAYLCNVQRSEYRKREGRVHTCRQPCAHGRRSFFRHSTIGCTDARRRMWHTGRKECDCKRGKCINIQSDCINMQNWPHENRVYGHGFPFGRKYAKIL